MEYEKNPYQVPNPQLNYDAPFSDTDYFVKASRTERLIAALFDAFLLLFLMSPIVILSFYVEGVDQELIGRGLAYYLLFCGFLILIVNGVLLLKNGQTVGKKALKIKIARTNGTPASFLRIVGLRILVSSILGMIPFFGLIDVLVIFGEEQRCIHDRLADTIVVRC